MRSVRHYEVMIIIDPSQDERTVGPSLEKYLDVVRKENGKVEKAVSYTHLTLPTTR